MVTTLKRVFPYLAATVISLWPLSIGPIVFGFRLFEIGLFVFYFVGLFLLLSGRGQLRRLKEMMRSPFFWFLALHVGSLILVSGSEGFLFLWNESGDLHKPFIADLAGALLFFFLLTNLLKTADLSKLLGTIVEVTCFTTLYLLLVHSLYYESPYLTAAVGGNPFEVSGWATRNPFGFFLVLIFPFAFASYCQRRTAWGAIKCLIILSAIAYLLSRMAVGATLLALFVFCVFPSGKRKEVLLSSTVLFVAVSAGALVLRVGPQDYLEWRQEAILASGNRPTVAEWVPLTGSRVDYLRQGFQGFLDKPMWGHGLGTFREDNSVLRTDGTVVRYPLTHNDYVQILYELGLVGIVSFLCLFFYAFRKLLSVRSHIPEKHQWLWNGQFVSLVVLPACLLLVNAYESVPFWLVFAGSTVLGTSKTSHG